MGFYKTSLNTNWSAQGGISFTCIDEKTLLGDNVD